MTEIGVVTASRINLASGPAATGYAAAEVGGIAECRPWRKDRYAPAVHMIKLTATQEITPYK